MNVFGYVTERMQAETTAALDRVLGASWRTALLFRLSYRRRRGLMTDAKRAIH